MSLSLQRTFEQIGIQLSLDSNTLNAYAQADKIGGFDNRIPETEREWPLGSIWGVEGQILYALTRALKPAVIVQAGTGNGCSATHFGRALEANEYGKLITIDHDPGTGKWARIPNDLRNYMLFVIDDAAAWIEHEYDVEHYVEIDIFFQDATHHADGVRREILAVLPHIKPGGLIIVHDADHFVVGNQIVEGMKLAGLEPVIYGIEPSDCGLAIWQKPYPPDYDFTLTTEEFEDVRNGDTVKVEIEPRPPVNLPDEADIGIAEPAFVERKELHRVPFTATWIEEDKILAGSIPQLDEDLHQLRDMGIASIVSLTRRSITSYPFSPIEEKGWESIKRGEYDAVRDVMPKLPTAFDINQFAIPDGGLADDNIMLAAVNCLDACTKPAYIHCRGGIGRTGMILIAYYVLKRGMTLAEARELVKVRRNYEGNASAIDQGSPQREWIDALPERLEPLVIPELAPTIGYAYDEMGREDLIIELLERGYIIDEDIDGTGKGGYVKKGDLVKTLEEHDADLKRRGLKEDDEAE